MMKSERRQKENPMKRDEATRLKERKRSDTRLFWNRDRPARASTIYKIYQENCIQITKTKTKRNKIVAAAVLLLLLMNLIVTMYVACASMCSSKYY